MFQFAAFKPPAELALPAHREDYRHRPIYRPGWLGSKYLVASPASQSRLVLPGFGSIFKMSILYFQHISTGEIFNDNAIFPK